MPVFEAFRLALQTIRAQKLKSGFSLLGVFIGVASLIAAWSIANGVNRYMTEKFAQTLYGVNTFQLRRRPMFTPNVPDSVWRAWARRPRIRFSDAEAISAGLTVPVMTAWQSSDQVTVSYANKEARDIELTTASERYFDIKNLRIAIGRPFTGEENRSGAVLFAGERAADRDAEVLDVEVALARGRELDVARFFIRIRDGDLIARLPGGHHRNRQTRADGLGVAEADARPPRPGAPDRVGHVGREHRAAAKLEGIHPVECLGKLFRHVAV